MFLRPSKTFGKTYISTTIIMSTTQIINYIVTTGDISDFDGFLALPIYKKKALEMGQTAVVFIMNYPAYFNYDDTISTSNSNIRKYGRNDEGLGYKYSAEKLFAFQNTKINEIFNDPINTLQSKMKNLAKIMCRRIWDSIPSASHVDLIFIDGGINEINPFSIDTIKNEFDVYSSTLIKNPDVVSYNGANFTSKPNVVGCSECFKEMGLDEWKNLVLRNNADIYMDMNGSMAFYDYRFKELVDAGRVKSVTIMGGVLSYEMVQTLSTTSFLNRFSSATMNQLYAPTKTSKFFADIIVANAKNAIHVYVVSNNEINKNFTYSGNTRDLALSTFITKMEELGLLLPNSPKNIMTQLFKAFYTAKTNSGFLVPIPFKPFDVLSAWELVKRIPIVSNYDPKHNLTFIPWYGSTIISKTDCENPVQDFIDKGLQLKVIELNKKLELDRTSAFITSALEGIENERQALKTSNINTTQIIPIINVEYDLQVQIENGIKGFMKGIEGGRSSKPVKTSRKPVKTTERYGRFVIYVGPRGGKYVKRNGLFHSLKKLS